MNLETYVAGLSPQRRALFALLTARASLLAAEYPNIQEFVFVAGYKHPTWDGGDAALWRAIEQLMLVAPAGGDELPIMWIGYDSTRRLSDRRESQGFLVTDQRLIVKDTVDLVFSKGEERQYPLYVGPNGIAGSAAAIASAAIDRYDWDDAGSLVDAEDAEWCSHLLVSVITSILETLTTTGADLADAPVTATEIRDRVKELGLGAGVKYVDDIKQAKHFARFAKKMPLDEGEHVLASFSESTLAGVYGIMLTDRYLRSRDLMEEPTVTPRTHIDPAAVRISPENKHKLIVAAGEVHDIPSSMGEKETTALVTLIQEWAATKIN